MIFLIIDDTDRATSHEARASVMMRLYILATSDVDDEGMELLPDFVASTCFD